MQGWRPWQPGAHGMSKIDRVTIRLARETFNRLQAEADRQRRTVADLARLTLADNLPPLPAEKTDAIAA